MILLNNLKIYHRYKMKLTNYDLDIQPLNGYTEQFTEDNRYSITTKETKDIFKTRDLKKYN